MRLRVMLAVAFLLGGLGFIVSRPIILQSLGNADPNVAFITWYVLFFAYVQFASLVLFHRLDFGTFRGGIGIVILTFAWGIVAYFPASDYALKVVGGNPATTPSFLLGSEDQLVYSFYNALLPGFPNYWMGILVYVVTPAILGMMAVLVIGPRRILTAFGRLLGLSNGG